MKKSMIEYFYKMKFDDVDSRKIDQEEYGGFFISYFLYGIFFGDSDDTYFPDYAYFSVSGQELRKKIHDVAVEISFFPEHLSIFYDEFIMSGTRMEQTVFSISWQSGTDIVR